MSDKTLSANAATKIMRLMSYLDAEDLKAVIDIAYKNKYALERKQKGKCLMAGLYTDN